MSSLDQYKQNPSQYTENGHGSSLRSGLAFTFEAIIAALASAGVAEVRFTTGANAIVFEGGDVNINQEDVLFEVYEDTTFTVAGTPNATYAKNSNRINPIATTITFYNGVTVDAAGTQVLRQSVKGAAGQNLNRPGFGSGGPDDSIILKPSTEHIFRITNNSALAVDVDARFKYREVSSIQY